MNSETTKSMTLSKRIMIASAVAFVLSGCGGSGNSDSAKGGDFPLEVEGKINGAFSESYEVTSAVLKVGEMPEFGWVRQGSKLLVEIKRTSTDLPLDPNDAQVCGVGAGKNFEWCISADVLGEGNMPLHTNMDKYGYDPFEKSLSLNTGETIWLEFSVGEELENNPSKAKKVKLNSSLENRNLERSEAAGSSNTTSAYGYESGRQSENWDEVLQSYEKYIDQYIKLLKKANSGDASAMADYPEMMERATDLAEKLENADDELSHTQLEKLVKLQAKFASAAIGM